MNIVVCLPDCGSLDVLASGAGAASPCFSDSDSVDSCMLDNRFCTKFIQLFTELILHWVVKRVERALILCFFKPPSQYLFVTTKKVYLFLKILLKLTIELLKCKGLQSTRRR